MADDNRTILLKIQIDGKEAVQEIRVTAKEWENFTGAVSKSNLMLDQFKNQLLQVEAGDKNAVESIAEFIQYNQLSEAQINQVIQSLREEQKSLAFMSAEYKQHDLAIQRMGDAVGRLTVQQGQNTMQNNAMRMGIMQTGFALSDASTFLVSFKMGMMAIGNNVPMIITLFKQAAEQAKTMGQTFRQALTASIAGGGGLILAANALTIAMVGLPMLFDKLSDSTEKLTEKMGDQEDQLRKNQSEFNSLMKILQDTTKEENLRTQALETLKSKYPEYVAFLQDEKENTESITEALRKGNEEFEKKIKLAASERVLNEYYSQAAQAEFEIAKKRESLAEMQRQFDEGNKARGFTIASITTDIENLEKEKQTALEKADKYLKDFLTTSGEVDDAESGSIAARKKFLETQLKLYEEQWLKLAAGDDKGKAELLNKVEIVKKELETLNLDSKDKSGRGNRSANRYAAEAAKAEELKGKLAELRIEQNQMTTEYEKQQQILQLNYNTKIASIDAEITALQKKEKLTEADNQKIKNLQTEKLIAGEELNKAQTDLDNEYYTEQAKAQYEFEQNKLKINKESEVKILESKRQFVQTMYMIEQDPDKAAEYMRQMELLDDQITQKKIENAYKVRDLQAEANRDALDQEDEDIENWYAEQKELDLYKNNADAKYAIDQIYANKKEKLDIERTQRELQQLGKITDAYASSFGALYDLALQSMGDDIRLWKEKEDKKLDETYDAQKKYARTQREKEKIDKEYQENKEKLELQAQSKAEERLGFWFRLQQIAQIGQTIMNTYSAATAALLPPPTGLGPIFGPALAAATIIGGMANVAVIANQKVPGMRRGGLSEKGQPYYMEGEEPEIIAPQRTYAEMQADLTMKTVEAVKEGMVIQNFNTVDNSQIVEELKNTREVNSKLLQTLEQGVFALIGDSEINRLYNRARFNRSRRGF